MNLIFLDIDGTLNSTRYYEANKPLPLGTEGAIDPDACRIMNKLTDRPGFITVISSSWKTQGLEKVKRYLSSRGLRASIIGSTPTLININRSHEIMEWLRQADYMGFKWNRYMVIDDLADANCGGLPFSTYGAFLHLNHVDGITEEAVQRALEIEKQGGWQ